MLCPLKTTSGVIWALQHLNPSGGQHVAQTDKKENTEGPHDWPFGRGIHRFPSQKASDAGDNRADSMFAPSQWETPLQSNAVSHWLGTNLESARW